TRPRFRGSARHRSLRAAIEWSCALLPDAELRLFDGLGVLAGQFTAETAHAVAGDAGPAPAPPLEALDALVAAALVVAEPAGGVTRYRLLDTLRTFAQERLAAA